MNKKRKGFTLIELLAVIVILGLLMAIAIPSVTKYITQSRKKTVTTTIGNYIGALTNQVNDMEYVFTASNTVYAVPIECIALERGGTNPFGKWYQASNAYWAYVLVQYDDNTSSYTYGFTFKDSAGYGLYPTTSEKLNENGSQIQTGLNLTKPTSGNISNITEKDNWIGFDLSDDTALVLLESAAEGEKGDGSTTCTLCQKGDNYEEIEKNKKNNLSYIIKVGDYIKMVPSTTTFTTDYKITGGTNVTFNPSNTDLWRVIRINSDKSVEVVSHYIPSVNFYFSTMKGYTSLVGYSNLLATKFENNKYTIGSRAMGYSGQTEYLDYDTLSIHDEIFLDKSKFICKATTVDNSKESIGCGDIMYKSDVELVENALGTLKATRKGTSEWTYYSLASRHVDYNESSSNILVWSKRVVNPSGNVSTLSVADNCTSTCGMSYTPIAIRPILILKPNITITSGDGTSSSPYQLAN